MDPAHKGVCFPLSEPERRRILPFAQEHGLPDHDSVATSPVFLRAMKALFPGKTALLESLFPIPGEHAILPINPDGSCVFLGEEGCGLPREARPWYCRLFPLWVRKGKLDRFIPEECLIATEARTLGSVLECLDMDAGQALELHQALCRDWGIADSAAPEQP